MESLSSALESSLRGSSEYEQSVSDDSTDSGQAGDLDLDLDFDSEEYEYSDPDLGSS